MPNTLNEFCDLAVNNAKKKGFIDVNIPTQLMLIVTEVSEAMEDHRKGLKPDEFIYTTADGVTYSSEDSLFHVELNGPHPQKPCGIPSEIADIVIRCFDFCGRYGIDLDRAVSEKMSYNATRKFKHGKNL